MFGYCVLSSGSHKTKQCKPNHLPIFKGLNSKICRNCKYQYYNTVTFKLYNSEQFQVKVYYTTTPDMAHIRGSTWVRSLRIARVGGRCLYVYALQNMNDYRLLLGTARCCINLMSQFHCCFTVHFDKYKIILPTNAPFIKT